MGELFDLLQGHVERWDGLRDQTLSDEERRKTGKSADCQHISSRTYILPCLIPSLVLKLPQILSTLDIIRRSSHFIFNATCFICASEHFLRRTSGGVFVGGVVSEALEEALEGDGLIDSFESLSASLAPLPFTWKHKRSSASLLSEKKTIKYTKNLMNILPGRLSCERVTFQQMTLGKYHSFFPAVVRYQTTPQGGSLAFELVIR